MLISILILDEDKGKFSFSNNADVNVFTILHISRDDDVQEVSFSIEVHELISRTSQDDLIVDH